MYIPDEIIYKATCLSEVNVNYIVSSTCFIALARNTFQRTLKTHETCTFAEINNEQWTHIESSDSDHFRSSFISPLVLHSKPFRLLLMSRVHCLIFMKASSLKRFVCCDCPGWYTLVTKFARSWFRFAPPAIQSLYTSCGTTFFLQARFNHCHASGLVIELMTEGAVATLLSAGATSSGEPVCLAETRFVCIKTFTCI